MLSDASRDIRLGDVNGDGLPDILVANSGVGNGAACLYLQVKKCNENKSKEDRD